MQLSQSLYRIHKKKALDEIFHYYTKQYVISTPKKTFEGLNTELNRMELGFFLKLLKDFRIPIETRRAKEIFVKGTVDGRNIEINCFETVLNQVALNLYKQLFEEIKGVDISEESQIQYFDNLMGLFDPNIVFFINSK